MIRGADDGWSATRNGDIFFFFELLYGHGPLGSADFRGYETTSEAASQDENT